MSSSLTPNPIPLSANASLMATSFILYVMLSSLCVVDRDFAYISKKQYVAGDTGTELILIVAR